MAGSGVHQMAILQTLESGDCLTVDTIGERTAISNRKVAKAAGKLIARGFVERIERGCYQLTEDGQTFVASGVDIISGPQKAHTGQKAPVANTLRQRAWTVMRMSGAFTIGDLQIAAASGDERDAVGNLRRYLKALTAAGYVMEMPVRAAGTKLTSNGFKRWRLLKDTGPLAPVVSAKVSGLIDHNFGKPGEVVPCR